MTPLIDGLKKYIAQQNTIMHMPGHKAKKDLKDLAKLIPEIDLTEVRGVDNLQNPQSIILESQNYASEVFGAKHTYYSVNGTTGGIYAAINSQLSPNDSILIARDSHKSVYQASIIARLNISYIYPEYDKSNNILLGITAEQIETSLKNNIEIKAVVINYPSYYGVCSNIEDIVKVVHKYNRLLIVDEAHGSHLIFHNKLPKSALESGADIVIQSTHKTLPAFTQSSMVHIGTERVDKEKLEQNMAIFQTTSPSYILMSSIEYAVDYMDNYGYNRLTKIITKIDEITDYLRNIEGVEIYNGKGVENKPYDFDQTKFLFKISGIKGTRLEEILRFDYKIQVELSDHYYCLALITVLDDLEDLEKLKLAIEDISKKQEYQQKYWGKQKKDIREIAAKIKQPVYKAFYISKTSVQLKASVDKISGEFIIPYPPGIPILAPGEQITQQIVTYIEQLKQDNIEILGLDEDNRQIKIIED